MNELVQELAKLAVIFQLGMYGGEQLAKWWNNRR